MPDERPLLQPEVTVLLDHDNIPFGRNPVNPLLLFCLDLVHDLLPPDGTVWLCARAYGGWYFGEYASESRYRAAEFYQEGFPAALLHRGRHCRLTFEFADDIAEFAVNRSTSGPVRVTNTVAYRGSAHRIRTSPAAFNCDEPTCELPTIRKWLRRARACTAAACVHEFADAFRRLEQKQVDIHLALDLIAFSECLSSGQSVVVVSDDIDILPALAVAARRRPPGATIGLVRAQSGVAYLDPFLESQGVRIGYPSLA